MIEQHVDQEKIARLANGLQRLAQDELLIERGILDLKNQLTQTCVLLNQQIGGTAVVSVTERSALEVVIEFRGRELVRCEFADRGVRVGQPCSSEREHATQRAPGHGQHVEHTLRRERTRRHLLAQHRIRSSGR